MLSMVKSEIRGGIVQVIHRLSCINNHYMPSYNLSLLEIYIVYLDLNNLYGWAMSQTLSGRGFKWILDADSWDAQKIHDFAIHNRKGYLLEVDVDYPRHLHDLHNDLPFLPEIIDDKVSPNLNDKRNYVCHIRLLDQALSHGLVLCRVHRVIEFDQISWMKPNVNFNISKRTAARNDFEKDFYKLMVNSVFRRTMERADRHWNIQFAMTEDQLNHLECKPNWIRTNDFENTFATLELNLHSG